MRNRGRIRKDGQLTVRVERDGEELLVRAFGGLHLANAKTLEGELRRAISGDAPGVVLDLSGVDFIDSAGLRVLLLMAKHSSRNGGRLCLLRGSDPVDRAVEVGGVAGLLPLAD
jgi:stage II sporulation protein AA (anti-sigma F factor antagonist)